ncbi:MAG: preprotein translocase subunit YajC [Bacteroidetes bacterium]|nr:MAG: preprotein translocase subunit YajC [Bacteroidota bacterium]TAG86559.1 MAG: preprotein translocase subunit YajC [Bacteroidota bacterium]
MLNFNIILLAGANNGGGLLPQLLLIGAIMLIFYLFMILPQQRKQKEVNKFRESIKVNDEIVTIGGLHGKIISMNETTVTIQADKNTKLTFERAAISIEATRRKQQGKPNTEEKSTNKEEMEEAIK